MRIDRPQLSGWSKARDGLHARMQELAETTIARWHFHDIRRTFRWNACKLGVERDITEMMLN